MTKRKGRYFWFPPGPGSTGPRVGGIKSKSNQICIDIAHVLHKKCITRCFTCWLSGTRYPDHSTPALPLSSVHLVHNLLLFALHHFGSRLDLPPPTTGLSSWDTVLNFFPGQQSVSFFTNSILLTKGGQQKMAKLICA